jgi:DNA-binding NarL/FixJ family response regulator
VIRVLVAARSGVVRAGLESLVRSSPALELAGALDWARVSSAQFPAEVVLLDAGDIPAERLAELAEGTSEPIVALLEPSDTSLASSALRAGIRGIVSREATPEEIESAIQAAHAGLIVVTDGLLPEILPELRPSGEALAEPLSDREREVLNLMAEGLSNKLIAQGLGISEHTVKTHVASIFAKLGAATRTEAVSQAIRRGLVML